MAVVALVMWLASPALVSAQDRLVRTFEELTVGGNEHLLVPAVGPVEGRGMVYVGIGRIVDLGPGQYGFGNGSWVIFRNGAAIHYHNVDTGVAGRVPGEFPEPSTLGLDMTISTDGRLAWMAETGSPPVRQIMTFRPGVDSVARAITPPTSDSTELQLTCDGDTLYTVARFWTATTSTSNLLACSLAATPPGWRQLNDTPLTAYRYAVGSGRVAWTESSGLRCRQGGVTLQLTNNPLDSQLAIHNNLLFLVRVGAIYYFDLSSSPPVYGVVARIPLVGTESLSVAHYGPRMTVIRFYITGGMFGYRQTGQWLYAETRPFLTDYTYLGYAYSYFMYALESQGAYAYYGYCYGLYSYLYDEYARAILPVEGSSHWSYLAYREYQVSFAWAACVWSYYAYVYETPGPYAYTSWLCNYYATYYSQLDLAVR